METQTIVACVLILALVSCLFAFRSAAKAKQMSRELGREVRSLNRRISDIDTQLEERLRMLGTLLLRVSQGKPVREEQVLSGSTYSEIDGEEGLEMIQQYPDTVIIDVREAHEYASSRIPGSRHIPLREVLVRMSEIPQSADRIIVHCAAGGRSAEACGLLGAEGYLNLYNLAGGITQWPGQVERGSAED